MSSTLVSLQAGLHRINHALGNAVAWMTLLMMLLTCSVVVLRHLFDVGSIALQESVTYLHGMVFMLGAAYTWQQDGHVRVDIFYRNCSAYRRAWVDLLGTLLLLLPVAIFMLLMCWEYVANSWAIREPSVESSGLPFVWLLKTLLLLLPATLILQAVAECIRLILEIRGGQRG